LRQGMSSFFFPSDYSTKLSTHFSDPSGTQNDKTRLKLLFINIMTFLLLLFLMSKHSPQDLIPPYNRTSLESIWNNRFIDSLIPCIPQISSRERERHDYLNLTDANIL